MRKTIADVQIGQKFEHGTKGEITCTDKTKRTLTFIHKFGKTKVTYRTYDAYFYASDV